MQIKLYQVIIFNIIYAVARNFSFSKGNWGTLVIYLLILRKKKSGLKEI